MAFRPAGDIARWRILYDLLRATSVGDILSYEKMAEALDLDPATERHIMQVAIRRAAEEFAFVDNHAVAAVPNVGYRVVEAKEHMDLAKGHQRRSRKQLMRAETKVVHVDVSALDPNSRKAFEVVATALAAQIDFCRRLDIRQRTLAQQLHAIQQDHRETSERTDEELARMRERLDRLEREGQEDAS